MSAPPHRPRLARPSLRWGLGAAALLALACAPLGCGAPAPGAPMGVVTGATPQERLEGAVGKAPTAKLSFEAVEQIGKYKGDLVVDRVGGFDGLDAGRGQIDALRDPELRALLEGDDEGKVADWMKAKGARLLLLHSAATPSVDRGRSVLSRLYHHDHLERFRLIRLTDGALIYKVGDPLPFSPQVAELGLRYLRARLSGQPASRLPKIDATDGVWTLVATVRGQGQELAVALGQDEDFGEAIDELAVDLEKVHRRRAEPLGFPPLRDHVATLTLELHRVTERASIEPRDEATLEAFWELGIDGVNLTSADGKERVVLPGASSYTRSLRSADGFLREAAVMDRMEERRPWRVEGSRLESWRSVHFREDGAGGILQLFRGVPPVPLSQVSVEAVRRGVVAAGDWYLTNLGPNGEINYKVWPSENRYANEYNHVRHALGTWNMVQAWQMDNSRTDMLEGAKRALGFTDRFLVRENDPKTGLPMAYHSFDDVQKLGSVVVSLLGMIDLARATNDHRWDEQMKEMGRFTLFMMEENGRFRPYHVPLGHPYEKQENDIVPGEAALALIHLAEYFDDNSWIAGLPKYWEFYEPWWRSRAAKVRPEQPWPAGRYLHDDRLDLVEIGPWTVMAANAYHRRTGDERVAAFGLDIARWMIETYQWSSETAPWPDYLGGYYKLPGELPAMQAFCYAEGTAAAYALAQRFRPADAPFFEQHTRETMRLALQMQYDDLSTYAFSRPDQVNGGIRYALNETKVRVDYVYHAQSAMYQYVVAARTDPQLPAAVRDGPATASQRLLDARSSALKDALEHGDLETAARLRPIRGRAITVPVPLRPNDALRFAGKPAPHPMAAGASAAAVGAADGDDGE
ncbi:MAG: hypothetical protein JNM72_17855 [Deltaproteobacteria bacterium]|nr:hypothetical protein [Deltaproteobacteria bacterium]